MIEKWLKVHKVSQFVNTHPTGHSSVEAQGRHVVFHRGRAPRFVVFAPRRSLLITCYERPPTHPLATTVSRRLLLCAPPDPAYKTSSTGRPSPLHAPAHGQLRPHPKPTDTPASYR